MDASDEVAGGDSHAENTVCVPCSTATSAVELAERRVDRARTATSRAAARPGTRAEADAAGLDRAPLRWVHRAPDHGETARGAAALRPPKRDRTASRGDRDPTNDSRESGGALGGFFNSSAQK